MSKKESQVQHEQETIRQNFGEFLNAFDSNKSTSSPIFVDAKSCFNDINRKNADFTSVELRD